MRSPAAYPAIPKNPHSPRSSESRYTQTIQSSHLTGECLATLSNSQRPFLTVGIPGACVVDTEGLTSSHRTSRPSGGWVRSDQYSGISHRKQRLKPIFHQNAKYLASGTFTSPNAKDSTSASPNARITTCWYILR